MVSARHQLSELLDQARALIFEEESVQCEHVSGRLIELGERIQETFFA